MSKIGYKTKNRIGEKFSRLTILRYSNLEEKNVKKKVECLCSCGNKIIVDECSLTGGLTKSCGCLKTESNKSRGDGHSKTPLYRIYHSMKSRCHNPNDSGYNNYGGRGIKVCQEWLNDYSLFYLWAISNEWKKGLEIDRRNNNAGYSPENCRIVTPVINKNNTRRTVMINHLGEIKPLTEWAKIFGISERRLRSRYCEYGMPFEKAIKNNLLHKERSN